MPDFLFMNIITLRISKRKLKQIENYRELEADNFEKLI